MTKVLASIPKVIKLKVTYLTRASMFSRMVLRLAVYMDQDRLLLLRVSKQLLMIHLLLHHLHLRVCHRYSLVFKVISFNSMLTSFGHLCLLEKVVSLHAG